MRLSMPGQPGSGASSRRLRHSLPSRCTAVRRLWTRRSSGVKACLRAAGGPIAAGVGDSVHCRPPSYARRVRRSATAPEPRPRPLRRARPPLPDRDETDRSRDRDAPGRSEEATAILQWAFGELEEMGASSVMSTVAAFLADALATEGAVADAIRSPSERASCRRPRRGDTGDVARCARKRDE